VSALEKFGDEIVSKRRYQRNSGLPVLNAVLVVLSFHKCILAWSRLALLLGGRRALRAA
jgi:hypothetical protein